jgi:SAM-dependent methyltransferase
MSSFPSGTPETPPKIFDRSLYLARQAKARGPAREALEARITEELQDRLSILTRQFDRALLIAPDNAVFADVIKASGKVAELDIRQPGEGDDLQLESDHYNAVFSLLDLHAANDVPGVLAQLSRALKPDGLLMLSFFAGETLSELREAWLAAEVSLTNGATPRVAPMIALRELGGLLQRAGLALPVADMDRVTLRYAEPLSLMREVKALGLSNNLMERSRKLATQALLMASAADYQSRFADADGRVRATIEIAWANAWKPHSSQPQPLKPGSAKARLAEALKVEETKL